MSGPTRQTPTKLHRRSGRIGAGRGGREFFSCWKNLLEEGGGGGGGGGGKRVFQNQNDTCMSLVAVVCVCDYSVCALKKSKRQLCWWGFFFLLFFLFFSAVIDPRRPTTRNFKRSWPRQRRQLQQQSVRQRLRQR